MLIMINVETSYRVFIGVGGEDGNKTSLKKLFIYIYTAWNIVKVCRIAVSIIK